MLADSGALVKGGLAIIKLLLKVAQLQHYLLPRPAVDAPSPVLSSRPTEIETPLPAAVRPVPDGAFALTSAAGHCRPPAAAEVSRICRG
jgi:hypothetical protein